MEWEDISEDHCHRFGVSDVERYFNDPAYKKKLGKIADKDHREMNKISKKRFNFNKILE